MTQHAASYRSATEYRSDKAELKGAGLLFLLMSILLVADWVLPQYFGVHIKFDITSTRFMNLVLLAYFLLNPKAGNHFLRTIPEVELTPFLALYMVVILYTTVLRVSVNTFFLNFLDILTFYMVYYGIRYVIGVRRTIDWTVKIAWVLGLYGIVEYILGYSPMVRYLMTVPNAAISVHRSGQYRIMGPCVHPIGYGMMLLFLIAIICIDYDSDEVYLFRHPALLVLLLINIFLTGSRGPLGLAALEVFLIVICSRGERRKKTFFYLILLLILFVMVEAAIFHTEVGQYIMMQLTSVIDQVFGTSFSVRFGADATLLGQSSSYREQLPKIFMVEWLNPLVGRGVNAQVGFEFDGVYVVSIDNFYVATYIRYAYPGLITFVLFQLMTAFFMIKNGLKHHSGLCIAAAIGFVMYSVSLFWVDYLQTTKYMYILIAIYCAWYGERFQEQDRHKQQQRRRHSTAGIVL
ncbi:MAG: hypothetical protein ACI4HQ_14825 [Acetatifactor sp.]